MLWFWSFFPVVWIAFLVYWRIKAAGSKTTQRSEPAASGILRALAFLVVVTAKVVIYEAFVEGKLEAPKHLARTVHDLYFEPKRGIPVANHLESLQRVHLGLQGT